MEEKQKVCSSSSRQRGVKFFNFPRNSAWYARFNSRCNGFIMCRLIQLYHYLKGSGMVEFFFPLIVLSARSVSNNRAIQQAACSPPVGCVWPRRVPFRSTRVRAHTKKRRWKILSKKFHENSCLLNIPCTHDTICWKNCLDTCGISTMPWSYSVSIQFSKSLVVNF
jgi:hypothetical protein